MNTEQNKETVRRWLEDVWGKGEFDLQHELLAPDLVDHNLAPGLSPGLEGQKQMVQMYRAAFDIDLHVDLLLAAGDYVIARNSNKMVQKGPFMGMPPTGKLLFVTGIDICRLEGGKIVELWHQEDFAGLLMQLGAIPAPGSAAKTAAERG